MAALLRVISAKWNPPKPSTASFEGKTILITAATGGLGIEAAKKLVTQGTSTLIITGRDEKKAAATKAELERLQSKTKIIPLSLEMSDAASIHAFIHALQQHVSHLDHAILNAGLAQSTYQTSSAGWEQTIQVNAISTVMLSLLLLPLLAASPLARDSDLHKRPHLVYISSGTAWVVKPQSQLKNIMASSTPLKDLSAKSNWSPGTMGGQAQYGRSKLVLEHCFRRIAALPYVKDSGVMVTSTCPGVCKSDLGRQFDSFALRWGVYFFMLLAAREGKDGANTYITALEQGGEAHGEMWKDDALLDTKAEVITNVKNDEAVAFGDKIWKEMQEVMREMDQGGNLGEVLG